MHTSKDLPQRPQSLGPGAMENGSTDGAVWMTPNPDVQGLSEALSRRERELHRQRLDYGNLKRFLREEIGQDLAGISYLLAAAQSPYAQPQDLAPNLRRVSEILSATLARCLRVADAPDTDHPLPAGLTSCSAPSEGTMTLDIDIDLDPES